MRATEDEHWKLRTTWWIRQNAKAADVREREQRTHDELLAREFHIATLKAFGKRRRRIS